MFYLLIGIFVFLPSIKIEIPPVALFLIFSVLMIWDYVTIPKRASYYNKKGLPLYALILFYWYLILLPVLNRRKEIVSEMAWIHMDSGEITEAGSLLSSIHQKDSEMLHAESISMARLLLCGGSPPERILDMAEQSISIEDSPRGWYLRGISQALMGNLKHALRSMEHCRVLSSESGDITLLGQSYLFLGIFWKLSGKNDYSRDHFLKADVLIEKIPPEIYINSKFQILPESMIMKNKNVFKEMI
ncbi:MAG: hypothetical protein JXR95_06465 [Deltaproteobacteria bacterium]|nr:hypothetical protein [Deltaproteobacteria bacterium]